MRTALRLRARPSTLLELRTKAGLSRRELADLAGVSQSAIFSAECGSHRARPKTVLAIQGAIVAAIRKAKENRPFSMRCRWCGEKIEAIMFDSESGKMLLHDNGWKVFNGWFYHAACLEEKARADAAYPELNK